ncbi:MAG: hypothetical protein AB7D37_11240 [Desulfovibrio sp.]
MTRLEREVQDGHKQFRNHEAIASGLFEPGKPWHVLWKQDGTSIYYMDIIILRNNLYISGDLGEAVYCWGDKITPDFLVGLDVGYFFSKCEASENGRRGKEWLESAAMDWLKEQWEEVIAEHGNDLSMVAIATELFEDLRAVAHSEWEWRSKVMEFHESTDDPISKVLGDEAYSESGLWDAGNVPMARIILHWLGIKLAFKSLGFGKEEKAA